MNRLVMAAAGAAVLGLTACSGSSPSGHAASGTTYKAPVSCQQQYRAWSHQHGKGVMVALHGVGTAASAGDRHALGVALRQARPAVTVAARHPIPACADPRGYWNVVLMHVNAAAEPRGSAASIRAAVHDVPRILHQLDASVQRSIRATG